MTTRLFAFGKNKVNECECPALAAGFDPREQKAAEEVAVEYDGVCELLRTGHDKYGKIQEKEAKEAWLRAVSGCPKDSGKRKVGEKVAEKLGWL